MNVVNRGISQVKSVKTCPGIQHYPDSLILAYLGFGAGKYLILRILYKMSLLFGLPFSAYFGLSLLMFLDLLT